MPRPSPLMARESLVLIHATAGIAGLAAGAFVLGVPRKENPRGILRVTYAALIGIMLVTLVALVALDWDGLDVTARLAVAGLAGLGAVMAYRIGRAISLAHTRGEEWRRRYVDHVAFTYISLWVGFLVLPAVRSSHPQIWVPVVAIGVIALGIALKGRYKRSIGLGSG